MSYEDVRNKAESLVFPEVQWVKSGGSLVGKLFGVSAEVEIYGTDEVPMFTVILPANSRYGYQRGGRDGERTISEIKSLVEEDLKTFYKEKYAHALSVVESVEEQQKQIKGE